MTKARQNPIGLDAQGLMLVRVGKGEFLHLWDAEMPIVIQGEVKGRGIHLCQSGKNAGSRGGSGVTTNPSIAHDARFVTCYRCSRLASMNRNRYGTFLRPRG